MSGPIPSKYPRRMLAAILGVAATVRIVAVAVAAREPGRVSDQQAYLALGHSLATGGGYGSYIPGPTILSSASAYHPIGYPGLLGILFWFGDRFSIDNVALAFLLNIVVGVLTVAIVFDIGRRLFDTATGCAAALLVALWPNLVLYTATMFSETVYTFTACLAVWIVVACPWPAGLTTRRSLVFGVALGASILVRPFSGLLLVAVCFAALVSRMSWRSVGRFGGLALITAIAIMLPWTIRNAIEMHSFVPVSTNLGDGLCIDNRPGATGAYGGSAMTKYCASTITSTNLTTREVEANQRNTRRAFKWMAGNPLTVASLVPMRVFYSYWNDHDAVDDIQAERPTPFADRDAQILRTLSDAYFFFVIGSALVGLAWFVSRSDGRRLFIALSAAVLAATPIYLYGLPRFHVPAAPLLALLAAPPLVAMFRAARAARHQSPSAVAEQSLQPATR